MAEEEAVNRLQKCERKRDILFLLFMVSLGEDDHSQALSWPTQTASVLGDIQRYVIDKRTPYQNDSILINLNDVFINSKSLKCKIYCVSPED